MNKKFHCFLSFVLQPGMCQDQNIFTDVTIFVQLLTYIFFQVEKTFDSFQENFDLTIYLIPVLYIKFFMCFINLFFLSDQGV